MKIDANAFERVLDRNMPAAQIGEGKEGERSRKLYTMRTALCWLIQRAFLADSSLTNTQKLRFAQYVSAPEVERQPDLWRERFAELANETKQTDMAQLYALASDACGTVEPAPLEYEPEAHELACAVEGLAERRAS